MWTDYKITSIEDQQKFLVPLNDITENLWYNQRMIIDAKVSTEPRAWEISKVNRISPNGLVKVTLAQDNFDQHNDYIERDSDNKIIGMWADYYKTTVTEFNKEENSDVIRNNLVSDYYSSIAYSGAKPQLKIGGSYKKFTVNFYDNKTKQELDFKNGNWNFKFKDEDSDILSVLQILNEASDLKENQVKIKFTGDLSYIGKRIIVSYIDENSNETCIEIEIVGL